MCKGRANDAREKCEGKDTGERKRGAPQEGVYRKGVYRWGVYRRAGECTARGVYCRGV